MSAQSRYRLPDAFREFRLGSFHTCSWTARAPSCREHRTIREGRLTSRHRLEALAAVPTRASFFSASGGRSSGLARWPYSGFC